MRSLQSFLSKDLIPAVISALCKLVSNDGHKSSIHEEFDDILKRAGKPKKLALYKERRFGLLALGVMLSGNHKDIDDIVNFPDESMMLSVLDNPDNEGVAEEEEYEGDEEIPLNEPCAVIWDNSTGRECFIGMTRERISKDVYLIDYLESDARDSSGQLWRYPHKEDEQPTKTIQVIPCNVIGAWDLTKRKTTFTLHNHEIIDGLFNHCTITIKTQFVTFNLRLAETDRFALLEYIYHC